MNSDLRVVIFGYGLAGRSFHAPLIQATEGLAVAGIVTADAERTAQAYGDNLGVQVYASAEEAFAQSDDFDLAIIAGANSSHVPYAMRAIDAGWHAVVDKPFAPNAAAAHEIFTAAASRGVVITAFHNRRWDSDFLTIDALMRTAPIGPVHRLESRLERLRPVPQRSWKGSNDPAELAGLLLDFGSHLVDQAIQLMGPVAFVDCWTRNVRSPDSPVDDLHITLFHSSGAVSEIIGSQASVFTEPRFTVLGLTGGIRTLGFDIQEPQLRANPDASAPDFGVEPVDAAAYVITIDANGSARESREPLIRGAWNGFYPAIRDAIRHGSPLPVPPQDVIETLRVLDAAAASAVQGNRVRLQPPARHTRHTE
jgi:predicted dehydrogenase